MYYQICCVDCNQCSLKYCCCCSPSATRSPSPVYKSDTECERQRQEETEVEHLLPPPDTMWEWGQLPQPLPSPSQDQALSSKDEPASTSAQGSGMCTSNARLIQAELYIFAVIALEERRCSWLVYMIFLFLWIVFYTLFSNNVHLYLL